MRACQGCGKNISTNWNSMSDPACASFPAFAFSSTPFALTSRLALLTGNIERGARLKLSGPALNGYFPFGAFGSDSPRREELVPIAVQRSGHRFSGRDVVIIGDSIYDVRCGTPHSATTIAIASGKTSAELLRAENPNHFFESAEDPGLLNAILT